MTRLLVDCKLIVVEKANSTLGNVKTPEERTDYI